MKTHYLGMAVIAIMALTAIALPALATNEAAPANSYQQHIFVANKTSYKPSLAVEPGMINAWGISNRPKGAGGHFWVTGKETSFEYVGDVTASADEKLRQLHVDKLKYVKLPVGGAGLMATGTVFSDSKDNFIITQVIPGVEPITAPAKFMFASDGGVISAWTERKLADGSFDRSGVANNVIDKSKEGAAYFGLAISAAYDRIYAANFGKHTGSGIEMFDGTFKPLDVKFDMPFDTNKNGQVDAGEYAPFNVQALTTPEAGCPDKCFFYRPEAHHIFVTYAKTKPCPKDEIAKGECKKGEIFAGEEDADKPGQGRLAEFTEDGKLVQVWNDGGKLSAPWGLAFAPANFGALSGKLLVGNFGDVTITAFDPETRKFVAYMKDETGKAVHIEKLWGLLFGNGESLGDSNALYFAAGPKDEKDGVFGVLRVAAGQ